MSDHRSQHVAVSVVADIQLELWPILMIRYEMAEDNEIGFNEGDKITNINKVCL